MDQDDAVLKWIEARAETNLRSKIETATLIVKAAETTLTLLLAGIGGSLAYAVKVFAAKPGSVEVGAAVLCAYLVLCAWVLVAKCLLLLRVPTLANEPKILLNASSTRPFDHLRRDELMEMQERIERYAEVSNERAPWLNRVRKAAIASPVVFSAAALLWQWRTGP